MKVYVYFNLHKKLFSVKALEGPNKGRVVAHRRELSLRYVEFKVSESGRQRVLQEKRKNVHAGVVGYWDDINHSVDNEIEVTYNPYKYDSFVFKHNESAIKQSVDAHLVDRKIFV